jgi:hypothetical protein
MKLMMLMMQPLIFLIQFPHKCSSRRERRFLKQCALTMAREYCVQRFPRSLRAYLSVAQNLTAAITIVAPH